MCNSDCKSLNVKFKCAYYLVKYERTHSGYLRLFSLHDAEGIKKTIKTAFARLRINNFASHLLGLNADGDSINMGANEGLGTLIKQEAPWLSLVHCFNHCFSQTGN